MAKYIDADKLWNRLISVSENDWVSFDTIDEVLSGMPAADVVEVRHGRWLMTDAYPHRVYCSECYATLIPNVEWFKTYNIASNYCPNCGAKMDGEEE